MWFSKKDFVNAANCYEQLTIYHPEEEDYKIYYAQALYQACLYEEAMKVTVQIENPEMNGKVIEMPKNILSFILRISCQNYIIIKVTLTI